MLRKRAVGQGDGYAMLGCEVRLASFKGLTGLPTFGHSRSLSATAQQCFANFHFVLTSMNINQQQIYVMT